MNLHMYYQLEAKYSSISNKVCESANVQLSSTC